MLLCHAQRLPTLPTASKSPNSDWWKGDASVYIQKHPLESYSSYWMVEEKHVRKKINYTSLALIFYAIISTSAYNSDWRNGDANANEYSSRCTITLWPCTRAFSSTFSQSYLTRIMEIKWIYIVNHVIGSIINVPTLDDHARAFNFPLHMYNFIMCYMRIHTEWDRRAQWQLSATRPWRNALTLCDHARALFLHT